MYYIRFEKDPDVNNQDWGARFEASKCKRWGSTLLGVEKPDLSWDLIDFGIRTTHRQQKPFCEVFLPFCD